MQWLFSKYISSRNKTIEFFELRWRLTVERDIFILMNTLVVKKYGLIDDLESADKDETI